MDSIITFDDGFESIYNNAFPILQEYNLKAIVFPIVYYIGKQNKWDYNFKLNKSNHLTNNQLLELHKNGWEIGSHGFFHHPYSHMTIKEIKNDLIYSKKYLQNLIGNEVESFSIPFNYYSPELFKIILDVGYKKIYYNCFYKSRHYPKINNLIHRKTIFKTTSIQSIDNYLNNLSYNPPITDKIIQFCSNATIGLKHLL